MTTSNDYDFVPVTGGVDLSSDSVRDDVASLRQLVVHSQLDRHIVRLLALHKDLGVQFRNQDLGKLSDADKRLLLQDMNDVLGIAPLSPR